MIELTKEQERVLSLFKKADSALLEICREAISEGNGRHAGFARRRFMGQFGKLLEYYNTHETLYNQGLIDYFLREYYHHTAKGELTA